MRFRETFVRPLAIVALAAVVVAPAVPVAAAEPLRLFTLGTASLGGNYYAAGRAICRLINREGPADLRCSPEPTPGSQYNLIALAAGELDFAFVQSDWQNRAFEGTGVFAAAPMTDLRSVLSLYAEAVTLVVRRDAGIARLDDLRGRVVDLGNVSTARRGTVNRVLHGIGIDTDDFGAVVELSADAVGPELCSGRIDAAFVVIGHPNALLGDLLQRCDLRLVAIAGDPVRRFVSANRDFETYTISAGTYGPGTPAVRTVSTLATLVTRASVSPRLVDLVARVIVFDYERIAESVPAFGTRDLAAMRRAGLTAPLHPAAEAVFDAVLAPAAQ